MADRPDAASALLGRDLVRFFGAERLKGLTRLPDEPTLEDRPEQAFVREHVPAAPADERLVADVDGERLLASVRRHQAGARSGSGSSSGISSGRGGFSRSGTGGTGNALG